MNTNIVIVTIALIWVFCGALALWIKSEGKNPFNEMVRIWFLDQSLNGFKIIGTWICAFLWACVLGPSLLVESIYEKKQ